MRKCSINALDDVFAKIAENSSLYLPVDGESGAEYKKWQQGVKLSQSLNTNRSAKDFFFPQTENLMQFKVEGKQIEVIDTREENENFVIFGVKACDVRSFDILDSVFLSDPVDTYYANRRSHGTIVSMACTRPAETCFCSAFGIDAADPKGDVSCWIENGEIYFCANTEKGENFVKTIEDLTVSCDESAVQAQKEKTAEIMKRIPLAGLKTEGFGKDKTSKFFDSPEWAELSRACLGCGTCTFVCPTCQCYDIRDFDTGHGVIRYRCWDSCMYSEFTRMAHGNNRISQLERFRQRFMHKLVYYPTNNDGVFGCVGCGRCLSKCPISMNIVKVMKALGGKDDE